MSNTSPPNNIPSGYRWELMALLCCAYFFHQVDRAIFGVLTEKIQLELGLNDWQIGVSVWVLFFVLAVMVPVAGFLGDRWSKKWIITISLIFWSIATMLTGLVQGIVGIILFRSIATGGGESFYGPASTAMIAAFHKKTRALALSLHQASLYFALMISGFLGVWISTHVGWRSTFFVFGGAGVLLGIVFIFRLREPPKDVSDEGVSGKGATEKIPVFEAVGRIVRIPTALLLTVGFTAVVFVNNAYLQWAPKFIRHRFEVSEAEASGYGMLMHFLAAFIGVLLGGMLADALVPRFRSFRLVLQSTVMLLGAPLIFLIGQVREADVLWIILFLFGLFRGLYESNTHAAMFDVIPVRLRSTVVGLMLLVAMLLGSFSPLLFGYLGNRYGTGEGVALAFSIVSVTWLLGGLCILAALIFTFDKDRIDNT